MTLEVQIIGIARAISDKVSGFTVDREEVGSIWFKEVVVASSIDDIDLLQIEFIAGNIAPLAGNGQDVFKDSRIENPGLIVDIVDGRLVVWHPAEVPLQV